MALFDDAMFAPQNYAGAGGILGQLLQMLRANPTPSQGFAPDNAQLPMNSQPAQGVMPRMSAPPMQSGMPVGAMPEQMGQPYSLGPNPMPGGMQMSQMPGLPQQGGAQQQSSMPPPQQSAPFFGEGGGLQNKLYEMAGILNPHLAGHMNALQGRNLQTQAMKATYQALLDSGVPEPTARAAALNPDILKTIAGNTFDTKPTFGVTGENQLGVKQYGFINPASRTVTPANQSGGAQASAQGGIDPALTGEEFLSAVASDPQLGPGKAQMVKAIAEGRQPYPSGFLLKTPFGQWLTTAVGQYEPGLDATLIGQRATFNKQMGSATPSSVGGQKLLMGTALGHLGEAAEAAADMSNVNTPVAMLGKGINAVKNMGTEQAAKANKLAETVDRLSGEVGKLYSGSAGGGVSERDMTRSRFGANMTPAELAAGLEASRDLIKSKLAALENQQDQIFGPNSKNRVDFLGLNGRAALDKIDGAIAKLKGQGQSASTTQAGPSGAQEGRTATNPQTGAKLIFKNGQWVPLQ